MMRKQFNIFRILLIFSIFIAGFKVSAQENTISNEVVSFKKKENSSGVVFDISRERDEQLTDDTRYYEEQTLMNAKYRIEKRFWNLLDYKQESFRASLEAGPFGGYGELIDSSGTASLSADHSQYGIRTAANVEYLYRYYYDPKSYTLFDVSGWGRYEVYNQDTDGTSTDSDNDVTSIDDSDFKDRLRYGIEAKAGWGTGRLSPMNHLMTAHYLLEKYYPGRIFSDYEIAHFAQVIAGVKHSRDIKTVRSAEKEVDELISFTKNELMLASPESIEEEWNFGEFNPRYEGQCFEIGPFFQYYNQEPDFIYGAYVQFTSAKYKSVKWNRNFSANLNYNRYKEDSEWVTGEISLGWTYYSKLKSQFDFGVSYVPGIELNGFDDMGELSHNFVPYISYFTQVNAKSRVQLDFSWRIADGEQFMLTGPEFSLAIYRSKY